MTSGRDAIHCHPKMHTHTKFGIPTWYALDTIILKSRSEVKVKVTRNWYATLCHPKMHPHTKFGIPTSNNIGDMHRTRSGMDGRTDGRTVWLQYASQSFFGGIKNLLPNWYLPLQTSLKTKVCVEDEKFGLTRAKTLVWKDRWGWPHQQWVRLLSE